MLKCFWVNRKVTGLIGVGTRCMIAKVMRERDEVEYTESQLRTRSKSKVESTKSQWGTMSKVEYTKLQ